MKIQGRFSGVKVLQVKWSQMPLTVRGFLFPSKFVDGCALIINDVRSSLGDSSAAVNYCPVNGEKLDDAFVSFCFVIFIFNPKLLYVLYSGMRTFLRDSNV